MQLILMRHGEAQSPYDPSQPHKQIDDGQRQLTDLGKQQATSSATQLLAIYQPDLIVVSPLIRAQQTAQVLADLIPNVPMLTCQCIKPEDSAQQALEWLSQLELVQKPQCIVVVCHMNIIAYLDGLLLDESAAGFELAEVRTYEQSLICQGLSTLQHRFIPEIV